MDVFELRDRIVRDDYARYVSSFIEIADDRIRNEVEARFAEGVLWPEPLLQLNPAFAPGGSVDDLVAQKILHPLCSRIFRKDKDKYPPAGHLMHLYRHQADAIKAAQSGENYVLTTGTGSGKSISYIVPIVDHILKNGFGKGIQAIIVYPMNALANSQEKELDKFLESESQRFPISFRRYTGQESETARREILNNPPDILLTNYVMLELILTRVYEKKLVEAARGLKFLVFDELHTYRGRQGADVAMLIRRLRQELHDEGGDFQCIGTSATLAGPGTFAEKQRDVAALATKLFGSRVSPDNVIVETLRAETGAPNQDEASFRNGLAAFLSSGAALPTDYENFIRNPLAVWIENVIGVEMRDNRLERCAPRPLKGKNGLANALANITGLDEELCAGRIKEALAAGAKIRKPDTDKPVFTFKLHQFISKGDAVYATLEPEKSRYITMFGQKLAPGREGNAFLYPLSFCRECGKEYYSVALQKEAERGQMRFTPLNPADELEADIERGYIFISAKNPWPADFAEQLERLPEEWLEDKKGQLTVKNNRRLHLPQPCHIRPDGTVAPDPAPDAVQAWYFPAPFAFCPHCLVSYNPGVRDFSKLATLGTEGRSTAATILSMSTVNNLRREETLEPIARKFLCFSDNRQDASLQSGHFNDFVEISLIRSALFNALELAGATGLRYAELPARVFAALGAAYPDGTFPPAYYSSAPDARFNRPKAIEKAFQDVLEYRIYSDLRRGWRIVAPNLEQCGLLEIRYDSLDEICAADELWRGSDLLLAADPALRKKISLALLDFLRSRLAVNAACLKHDAQESIRRQSVQQLISPWRIEEEEKMNYAAIAWNRSRGPRDDGNDVFLTPGGDFGKWLKTRQALACGDKNKISGAIATLVSALKAGGILDEASRQKKGETGFQVSASAMIWLAGDGKKARRDRFRIRHASTEFGRTNPFLWISTATQSKAVPY